MARESDAGSRAEIGHVLDLTQVYAVGTAGGPTPKPVLRVITHHNGIRATL
jgi:hypothetical protein